MTTKLKFIYFCSLLFIISSCGTNTDTIPNSFNTHDEKILINKNIVGQKPFKIPEIIHFSNGQKFPLKLSGSIYISADTPFTGATQYLYHNETKSERITLEEYKEGKLPNSDIITNPKDAADEYFSSIKEFHKETLIRASTQYSNISEEYKRIDYFTKEACCLSGSLFKDSYTLGFIDGNWNTVHAYYYDGENYYKAIYQKFYIPSETLSGTIRDIKRLKNDIGEYSQYMSTIFQTQ